LHSRPLDVGGMRLIALTARNPILLEVSWTVRLFGRYH
jgi:hypothetical protein